MYASLNWNIRAEILTTTAVGTKSKKANSNHL